MGILNNGRRSVAADKILMFCFDVCRPVSTAEVAQELGMNQGTVTNAMVELTQRKQLYRCNWGRGTRNVRYSAFASHVEPKPPGYDAKADAVADVVQPRTRNIFGPVYVPPPDMASHARPGCTDFLAVPSRVGDKLNPYRAPRLLCD